MSEQPLVDCPACHQADFKRKPGGGPGLHFKGSGFYITDYNNTLQNHLQAAAALAEALLLAHHMVNAELRSF